MGKCFLLICVLFLVKSLIVISNGNDGIKYAANIWDSCESHRECKNLKYTKCDGGKCRCLPNYHTHNYRSCEGGINATCDSDYDCRDQDQVGCISNICQSYATFFTPLNAEKVKLWRATKMGSRCETDENCSDLPHSACKSGKCDCTKGYWKDYEICRPVIDTSCANHSDCKEVGTKCLLNNCIYPSDFFSESNADIVRDYAATKLADLCETDHHCRNINHSDCQNGTCGCAYGTVRIVYQRHDLTIENEECHQVLNVPCQNDHDCGYSIKCFFNKCSTPKDFFVPSNAHNVSLYTAKYIGDFCQTDHHCRNVENTHCYDGECLCKDNFARFYSDCLNLTDLYCTRNSDCKKHRPNIYCFSNACQHESFYFEKADIQKYKAKEVDSYCRNDDNCLEVKNTECSRNKCQCKEGYRLKSDECQKNPPADCSADHYCRGWDHYCFAGFCYTPEEFFESSSAETLDLYATDHIYGFCQTDHHCRNLNNTGCVNGQCRCPPGWEKISKVCQRILNATCSNDSDCVRTDTRCFFNTCLLPEDFFIPSNVEMTNLYAAERIYGSCGSDHHCRNLPNTYCFKDTCNCLSDYEYINGSCQKAINVTCSDDSDCLLPRSYCFINICLYPEDFLAPSNGYDIKLYAAKRIDGFCQTDHHCREIKDSKCFRRRCTCKEQFSLNGKEC